MRTPYVVAYTLLTKLKHCIPGNLVPFPPARTLKRPLHGGPPQLNFFQVVDIFRDIIIDMLRESRQALRANNLPVYEELKQCFKQH